MKHLPSLSGKVLFQSLVIGIGVLMLALAPPRRRSSSTPAPATREKVPGGHVSIDPAELDREQQRCRELHSRMDSIVQQLEMGSLTLEQAVALADQHIRVGYPGFLRFLETSYRGNTNRQTIAHHLVRRAIASWGPPAANPKTAALLDDYRTLFPLDELAQADLADACSDEEVRLARDRQICP